MPSTVRRSFATAALVVLTAWAVGCAPGNPDVDSLAATQGLPDLLVNLSASEWLLDPGDTTVDLGDQPVSLDFHPDRTASGVAPCNAYRAAVSIGDGTVTFTDVTTTLRSCEPDVMEHEDAFFAALAHVRDVDLTDRDRLILTTPDGERLTFDSFHAYDAIATTWTVVNLATDDALTTPPVGVDVRITFDEDRTLTVDAGCGERTGEWALDDDELTVSDLSPSTECAQSDAASVESDLIAALDSARTVQINPPTLTLVTSDDTIALVATTEP